MSVVATQITNQTTGRTYQSPRQRPAAEEMINDSPEKTKLWLPMLFVAIVFDLVDLLIWVIGIWTVIGGWVVGFIAAVLWNIFFFTWCYLNGIKPFSKKHATNVIANLASEYIVQLLPSCTLMVLLMRKKKTARVISRTSNRIRP